MGEERKDDTSGCMRKAGVGGRQSPGMRLDGAWGEESEQAWEFIFMHLGDLGTVYQILWLQKGNEKYLLVHWEKYLYLDFFKILWKKYIKGILVNYKGTIKTKSFYYLLHVLVEVIGCTIIVVELLLGEH